MARRQAVLRRAAVGTVLAVVAPLATAGAVVAVDTTVAAPVASGDSAPRLDCAALSCWRGSHSQTAKLRVGAAAGHEVAAGSVLRVRLARGTVGRLSLPAAAEATDVTIRPVRGIGGVKGLPARGARGIVVSFRPGPGEPLSLRFGLSKRQQRSTVVVAAHPDGGDLHRIGGFGARFDLALVRPMAVMVVPRARNSRWFRARSRAHMPADPAFKLDHVLAGAPGPDGRRSGDGSAWLRRPPSSAEFAAFTRATFRRQREYVAWLRDKYASDPARSVADVARVWLAALHQKAVAAQLGLADSDEVREEQDELAAYERRMIDEWLQRLAKPCLRQADVRTALRLLRHGQLRGLALDHSMSDFTTCPYRVRGAVSVRTHRDLMVDRAAGGWRIEDRSIDLEVRLLTTGLGLTGNEEVADIVDEGTTVDFSGARDYQSSSGAGTCAELIAAGYRQEVGEYGPYSGPVTTITAEIGDDARLLLSSSWRHPSHEISYSLRTVPSGCDWVTRENTTPGVSRLDVLGTADGAGAFTFDARPDPFTRVTGRLVLTEVVR